MRRTRGIVLTGGLFLVSALLWAAEPNTTATPTSAPTPPAPAVKAPPAKIAPWHEGLPYTVEPMGGPGVWVNDEGRVYLDEAPASLERWKQLRDYGYEAGKPFPPGDPLEQGKGPEVMYGGMQLATRLRGEPKVNVGKVWLVTPFETWSSIPAENQPTLLTTGEVASLQKRLKDLESKVAALEAKLQKK